MIILRIRTAAMTTVSNAADFRSMGEQAADGGPRHGNGRGTGVKELKRLEERTRRLEAELGTKRRAAADRDAMLEKVRAGAALLDSMGGQRVAAFDELIRGYGELCRERTGAGDRLAAALADGEGAARDRDGLLRELDRLKAAAKDARTATSRLEDEARELRRRLAVAEDEAVARRADLERAERRLEDAVRRADELEARVAGTAADNAALAERSRAELAKTERLLSSQAALHAENDAIRKSLRAELAAARDELDARTAETADAERLLCARQRECEAGDEECARLRCKADELRAVFDGERRRWEQERGDLAARAESQSTELAAKGAGLCEALAANGRLKFEFEDLAIAARKSALDVDQLRQVAKREGRAAELAAQKLDGERKQSVDEARLRERKLVLKTQETRELEQLAEEQARKIERLAAMRATDDERPVADPQPRPCATFASVLNAYVDLLCDDDDGTTPGGHARDDATAAAGRQSR